MKKTTAAVLFAVLAIGATSAYAGNAPQQGVLGSKHDITRAQPGYYRVDDFGRVCIYCHTPHNAQVNPLDNAPLWNRPDSAAGSLTAYVWSAPANMSLASDPTVGPSRLCLSCHDGLTAADGHSTTGTATGGNGNHVVQQSSGRAWADLGGTHPIGFKYADAFNARNTVGQTKELVDPADPNFLFIKTVTDPTTFDTVLRPAGSVKYTTKKISDTLYGGYVTCASCHDVHNTNNAVNTFTTNGATAPNYFTWAPEKDSALCISCHVK